MSELSKLAGKGKKIKLGEVGFVLNPLTASALPDLIDMTSQDRNIKSKAIEAIVETTLKDAFPDATDEEIKNVSWEHLQILIEEITSINKLDVNIDMDKLEQMRKNVERAQSARDKTE